MIINATRTIYRKMLDGRPKKCKLYYIGNTTWKLLVATVDPRLPTKLSYSNPEIYYLYGRLN